MIDAVIIHSTYLKEQLSFRTLLLVLLALFRGCKRSLFRKSVRCLTTLCKITPSDHNDALLRYRKRDRERQSAISDLQTRIVSPF